MRREGRTPPRRLGRWLLGVVATLVTAAALADGWPRQVVTIEQMRPLTPLRVGVPTLRAPGEVSRPALVRLHVGSDGQVRRVALIDSSGSPSHDEAAMHALRSVRFAPKLIDGVVADVTLLLPLHFPIRRPAVAERPEPAR